MKVYNKLINFCFKGRDGELTSTDGHGAKLAKKRRSGVEIFAKRTLIKVVKHLLQNCYFKIRQIVDPAPFFDDLFLHYYKSRSIHQLSKSESVYR